MEVARNVFVYDGMGVVVHTPTEVVVYVHPVIAAVGCRYAEVFANAMLRVGELACPETGGPGIILGRVGSFNVLVDTRRCIFIAINRDVPIAELAERQLSWVAHAISAAPALECDHQIERAECASLCREVGKAVSEANLICEILK